MKKIIIIGGGLVGLSIAYKLLIKSKKVNLTLYEKEKKTGLHQSSRNSGVLHCGLPYKPGSLKAKLTNSGLYQIKQFCIENNLNFDICGKLIVCQDINKRKLLDQLLKNGKKNGLKGLKILKANQINEIEPNISAPLALFVPEEGIVDYFSIAKKLTEKIKNKGGKIITNHEFSRNDLSDSNSIVINCAGLYSDKIYRKLTGLKPNLKIIPFRGDYFSVRKGLVKNLVYPIPDKKLPFLGVHFTRLTNGNSEVGPNAVLAFKREGYKLHDFSFLEFIETIFYIGLFKFVFKNFRFCLKQLMTSINKKTFYYEARKLVPNLKFSDILNERRSGVRAQAVSSKGNLVMDFVIKKYKNQIHILNAPSPGATSCLAIADYVIENYINLKK